jgi:MFS family permease
MNDVETAVSPPQEILMTAPSISARAALPFHYGWIIIAVGALVLFSCFGLARYAYGMLIPGMQAGLQLSYDRIGFIGTSNFIGYLVSVVLAPGVNRRLRPRVTISLGLLMIGCGMVAIGFCHSFAAVLALYAFVGAGGGFANVPMMALIMCWFRSEQRGKAAGLVIAGNGVGIILSGFLIPILNRAFGADGWRAAWMTLGALSLIVACCAALLLRNHPSDLGLEPVGNPLPVGEEQLVHRERRGDGMILLRLGVLYMLFGVTFLIFGTFIVTTMVKEYGFTEARAGFCWSWVGFFSLFSGVGFGWLSDRIGRKWGLTLVFIVQAVAYLLTGLKLGSLFLMIAIVLYGLAVFAIPAIMAAAIGDYLGLSRAASAFATITLFFAVGQAIGPAAAGVIAKHLGSFSLAYVCSALVTVLAALFAATLPAPPQKG